MKKRHNVPVKLEGYKVSDWEKKGSVNLYFEADHSVGTRPVLTKTNPTAIADALAGAAVAIHSFNSDTVWVSGSSLYLNGNNKHTYTATPVHSTMAELYNRLHVAFDWEGSSEIIGVLDSTGTWAETTGTYDGANKVKAGVVCEHRGILFCARMKEGATQYLHRIRWSNYGDAQDFDPSGDGSYDSYEDIGDDTDPIVNLVSLGNELIILKRRSIWVASGIASDVVAPEYVRQLSAEYGLVGPRAVTRYHNGIIFLSDVGLIYTDGHTFRNMDEDLWRWIRPTSTLTDNWRDQYVLWHERLRTLFVYDENTGVMYARTNGEWNAWIYGAPAALIRAFDLLGDVYFVTTTYGFLKLGRTPGTSALDVNGATTYNIAPILDIGWQDFGAASRKKLFRSVYVNRATSSPADHGMYTVTTYRDLTASDTSTDYLINNQGWADVDGSARKWKAVVTLTRPGTDTMDIDDMTVGFVLAGGV